MLIDLVFAAPAAADAGRRTVAGLAVPYGVASGPTSDGRRYRFAGPPANLGEAVDLVREHDPDAVIGRLSSWAPEPNGLGAVARLFATTAGTDALIEATEQVRTGFSVGADAEDDDMSLAPDGVYDLNTWTARHLGLVRRPAFAEATVARVAASAPAAPAPDQDDDQDDEDGDDADTDDQDDTDTPDTDAGDGAPHRDEDAMPAPTIAAAQVPAEHRGRRVSAVSGARLPRTLVEASAALASSAARHGVMRGETDAARINAALSDVTPGDGSSGLEGAFLRPEWLGELWTPDAADRPFVNAVGTVPLTAMTWQGWKWGAKPAVDKYTGNKTAIPSNAVTILPATGEAYRVAGGWDVDRIFFDLGSPDFIAAMFAAAAVDYDQKSEGWLASDLLAEATTLPAVASLVEALDAAARALVSAGARMSFVAMAPDLWADFISLPEAEVPWWLRNQASVSISDTTTDVAGIRIFVDSAIPAGDLVAGDRRAVDFRETGPIRVQAVNIPSGGIDIALFGYQGTIVREPSALVEVSVTAGLPLAARPSSS